MVCSGKVFWFGVNITELNRGGEGGDVAIFEIIFRTNLGHIVIQFNLENPKR